MNAGVLANKLSKNIKMASNDGPSKYPKIYAVNLQKLYNAYAWNSAGEEYMQLCIQ